MITTKAEIHLEKKISETFFLLSVSLQRYKEWVPGMFMQISLKEKTASEPWLDGHSFSFASWGSEKALILVRKEGMFTTELVKRSIEGFTTTVRYPFGDFLLTVGKDKVFLAGGAGISVFLSYLDFVNSSNSHFEEVFLFHTTKRASETIENVYWDKLPNFVLVRSFITGDGEPGYTGRFKLDDLTDEITDLKDKEYFICGPPKFNSFWKEKLNGIGICPKLEQWENTGDSN
jgi:NAD(P)H-flavin reductase